MPDKVLFACLCAAVFAVFILGIYIICAVRKRSVFSDIYRSNVRDERFANSLLSAVFGNKVIKNPYIIRDDSGVSPKVCSVIVCSGGIAVISICGGTGEFVAPDSGPWTVTDALGTRSIPNLVEAGQTYVSAISTLVMRKSLYCPAVRHYVFLTDDRAGYDFRSSDCVFTGAKLIAELKDFSEFGTLSSKEEKALYELILKNSEFCKNYQPEVSGKPSEDDSDMKIAVAAPAGTSVIPDEIIDIVSADSSDASDTADTSESNEVGEVPTNNDTAHTVVMKPVENRPEPTEEEEDDDDFSVAELFGMKK